MNTKYTPGPWRLNDALHEHVTDDIYHAIDAGRGVHDAATNTGFSLTGFMSLADACLIAATPDLAEALREMIDEWLSADKGTALGMERCIKARAALAKAGL
jgi:hypothetical protein